MRYAVKLMTSSDLTLFSAYFRQHSSSKQKGTNLNGEVLAGRLFPALPTAIIGTFEHPVVLDLYGPNGGSIHRVRRKIIKPEAGKNWRLNGKLIDAPDFDADRFDNLQPGDIAVFGFDGEPLPTTVSMVLLSAQSSLDSPSLAHLTVTRGLAARVRSMVEIGVTQLAAIPAPASHPLRLLLPDLERTEDLREIADDDDSARRRLDARARSGKARPVTASELAAAKVRVEEVGRAGEALFCGHLERELSAGRIGGFAWTADQNATSPYDFEVRSNDGASVLIDVKSTTAGFAGNVHVSAAELNTAAESADYRIARVYDLDDETGPKFRLSHPIQDLALGVTKALGALPDGVRASKLELHTRIFNWEIEAPLAEIDDD